MHSLPGFIIFFHEVSFFLPTNIGISSEPPHFACLFSFIAKNLNTSNPQPIGFRGNLLVKRQKFFYCTYSLGITETS